MVVWIKNHPLFEKKVYVKLMNYFLVRDHHNIQNLNDLVKKFQIHQHTGTYKEE